MKDHPTFPLPPHDTAILERSRAVAFDAPSDHATGGLLRCLVASKKGARVLELGTGTGLGTAWLLDGMDATSHLDSVETHQDCQNGARDFLSGDRRVTFVAGAGLRFLEAAKDEDYDFIFADTWPGKFVGLAHSLRVLCRQGMMVLDDLLPQPNWPSDHPPKVERLLAEIEGLPTAHYTVVKLCWYTGHIIITKREPHDPPVPTPDRARPGSSVTPPGAAPL